MPTYSYICNKCDHKFELFFSMLSYIEKPNCTNCFSNETQRNYQVDLGNITGSVIKSDSELSTLGDLANRNRDKMSDDQRSRLDHKHNSYKEQTSHKSLPAGMSRIKKPSYKIKWR